MTNQIEIFALRSFGALVFLFVRAFPILVPSGYSFFVARQFCLAGSSIVIQELTFLNIEPNFSIYSIHSPVSKDQTCVATPSLTDVSSMPFQFHVAILDFISRSHLLTFASLSHVWLEAGT